MGLTKLEEAIALSGCIKEIGVDATKELLGEKTFADLEKVSNEIIEKTTLKVLSDSGISLIKKLAISVLTKDG